MAVINVTEARIRDLEPGSGIWRDEQVKGLMVVCHATPRPMPSRATSAAMAGMSARCGSRSTAWTVAQAVVDLDDLDTVQECDGHGTGLSDAGEGGEELVDFGVGDAPGGAEERNARTRTGMAHTWIGAGSMPCWRVGSTARDRSSWSQVHLLQSIRRSRRGSPGPPFSSSSRSIPDRRRRRR